jgi:GT2 family glycosyltransferase/glycosyltransferase involved in cell wall biosynthesis
MSDTPRDAEKLAEAERQIAVLKLRLELQERLVGGSDDLLAAQIESANQRAAFALQQQHELLRSASWRLTAPLRKVSAAIPPSWRGHLRRAAKATWWVATPWRMPQRLQFLKERRRADEARGSRVVPADRLGAEGDAQNAYRQWIAEHALVCQAVAAPAISAGPRLSFLLCAGDAQTAALNETVKSICAQDFPQWQLVVAVTTANAGALDDLLRARQDEEPRIVPVPTHGKSRAEALAACFAHANGDFIAVLDAGDVIAPGAMSEIANALAEAPASDILYCDEDELSVEGGRTQPYFKPSWSPELLYAFNYFGRLTLLRRQLVEVAGGIDPEAGAGFEWDLNLRASDVAQTITRIPQVLCHRAAGGHRDRPAADSAEAAAQRAALRKFWAQKGIDASVQTQPDGTHHATWTLDQPPLVSIVIPSKNKDHLLRMSVGGLLQGTAYANKEIIIVDTGSTEPETLAYYAELASEPSVRIVHFNKTFNYSAACNYGAAFSHGEILLFLNNDIEVTSRDWLHEMVRVAMRPGVGVVGAKLVFPSGELQHGGVGVGIHLCGLMYRSAERLGWGVFGSPDHARNWLAIMGACQMVRRDAFERVGGFDESYLIAMSDVALCLHIWRAGYRVAYVPQARLVHHEGATRGSSNPEADMRRVADDIRALGIDDDPYLHPELDANYAIPSLRIGTAPAVREKLKASLREFGSPRPQAQTLDLSNDGACLTVAMLPRERVIWIPQPAHGVRDVWSAARWCLDLLRTRADVRLRFPAALSEGPDGAFCRWLETEGASRFELSQDALVSIRALLSEDLAVRARQAFLYHLDVRALLPHGLLPIGRRDLFHWFMQHGRSSAGLRLEEIWWLFWTAAETPEAELVRAYEFTPDWQKLYPDGLTVFGCRAFASWFCANYRVAELWTDPVRWPVDIAPARQLRSAYRAREQWQRTHPRALDNVEAAEALIDWLQLPEAMQSEAARAWCAGLDKKAVAAEMTSLGVNVIGHFSYPSGLRVSVEALVKGLRNVGVQTALRDLRTDKKDDPVHAQFRDYEDFETTIIHTQPEPFFNEAYSRSDLSEHVPRTYRIAYWYWEFDSIPDSWLDAAAKVDEVWTATEFVAKGLRERLSIPVRTIFPGVALGPYQQRERKYFGLKDGSFTFLFTFHMMSVMERKNPLGLIQAFKTAFSAQDDTTLVLKTSFGDRHPEQLQELRAAAAGHNIVVIDQVYSPDEVLSLMDACDAYVSLHRSEGLGLTMAEAMLMGKPVIATNYSGNVDFMGEEDSLLVPYKLVKLGRPIPPYDENLKWAEPSTTHAAQLMRRLYEDREWAKQVGARGKARAAIDLSLETAGQKAAARLAEIRASARTLSKR